ncbi:MAG: carbohydrate-binding domain-containing protein [Oscillospiraceae bacterium]|nr:carbohydrate-binding domain-containing protein [Oscillospiraceae bacterium]
MKTKLAKLLALLLAALTLFTACAVRTSPDTSSTELSEEYTYTYTDSEETDVYVLTETSSQTEESELFSNRDLSGDYDSSEAVTVTLNGASAQASSDSVQIGDGAVTITAAGTYILSGDYEGSIIVSATKDDKVQLVLDGVSIAAADYAAIYVAQADKVFLTLAEGSENTLSNGGSFTQIDDSNVDAVIFSRDDLTLNGTGTLRVTSPAGHGIVCKDELVITGGVYEIGAAKTAIRANDSIAISGGSFTLAAYTDGLHAENSDDDTLGSIYISGGDFRISVSDDAIHATALVQIDGGSFEIQAAEGIEGTYVQINDGEINITASDDGINAARKSSACTPTVEITGGSVTISMGAGDTDGIDSNGDVIISGSTVDITGNSTVDYDGSAQLTGGTLIVNGQQVTTVPNQMMGGMGGGMGNMGGRGGKGFPG